jgi:hypothetical protein
MKRHAEQPGIIPALALVANVEDEFFIARTGRIWERPDPAFAFPNAQLIRAGNGAEADAVGEEQIRERIDRRPVAGNAGRNFRQHVIKKGADARAIGEAKKFFGNNGLGISGQKNAAQQNEGQNPLAVLVKQLTHNRDSA